MSGQHALLSPSAAHRWLNCTAAPRLEAEVPDVDSAYAQEGTLAHAYGARKLKSFLGLDTRGEDAEIATLDAAYHTGEMDEYTDTYRAIVLEKYAAAKSKTPDAQLLIETRLDFTGFIPGAFGTADSVIIGDDLIEVIDFKYGKGVRVDATENPQMMIYALGAYLLFNFEYRTERVRMTIVQPRIDNLSEFEMSVPQLLDWAEEVLMPRAREAYAGKGPQVPGDWCRFCKVKSHCKSLATMCTDLAGNNPDPRLISARKMAADILPRLSMIKSWVDSVEEYALQQALSGTDYPGYKIVAGRSVRKISDAAAVTDILGKNGFAPEQIRKPAELRGITDLEKIVGKKRFNALCADFLIKPQGKPALVPETDKRPVYNAAADDFNDITI